MNGAAGANASPADASGADDRTAGHADLQALVIDASTTLLSANPDELDTKLTWTLRSIASGLGTDFAGVYEREGSDHGDGAAGFTRRYAWQRDELADGDSPPPAVERSAAAALDRVGGTDAVRVAGGDDGASPAPDSAADRNASCGPDEFGCALAVPIVRQYELWGALVFVGRINRQRWADHEVVLVRSLADMVASSLDRVERERQLKAQNDRLEEFAQVVSHDLRNPLNVLTASVDLVERTGDLDHLERAKRASERMDRIIDTVLGLSRAGQDIGETETVGVGRVARTAWEGVDTGDAELSVDAPGRYEADEGRLSDVFSNLFRNAVEHGSETVTVTVGGIDGDRDGFYVADDGPGLPDDADGLFEQGHSGDSGGTGLGLTIVRRVVEAHGWTVAATDSETGGARFDIVVGS